jgi:hypothetical protein
MYNVPQQIPHWRRVAIILKPTAAEDNTTCSLQCSIDAKCDIESTVCGAHSVTAHNAELTNAPRIVHCEQCCPLKADSPRL